MKYRILLASLCGLLVGCTQAIDSAPTPLPPDYLPTVVALTGQAAFATAESLTQAAVPTATPEPTFTPEPTVVLPSPTPTFAAGFTEFAQIHFVSPGPLSSLTSPFVLQTILVAGESEVVQVDLLGEDGRVLYRELKKLIRNPAGTFQRFEISFEIRAVSEAGYIRISTKDDFGRIQALNTMPVLLYSVGTTQVNPPGNTIYERVTVEGLKEKAEYTGGEVYLSGRLWPFNDQPVFVDITMQDGRPLSSRMLAFNGTETQSFETTLPYKVTEPTVARLSFRQDNPLLGVNDPELGKLIYVYTVEIVLNP
ncbi:MAG TPA: hypothetical protein DCY14_19315 [Anaerolineae bacterium]|nr:hypothetical protein [Anaerolineae bacterium]HRJ58823.1 hypothetical protein [Anaerolineales bacterium]